MEAETSRRDDNSVIPMHSYDIQIARQGTTNVDFLSNLRVGETILIVQEKSCWLFSKHKTKGRRTHRGSTVTTIVMPLKLSYQQGDPGKFQEFLLLILVEYLNCGVGQVAKPVHESDKRVSILMGN